MSQDEVSLNDIEFSRVLIDEFLGDFESLYGKKNQTFNLHCLQHLPDQVVKQGPLHFSDCFPFEGWFKNTKTLHNGTRNISGQIASNLNLKLKVHFELKDRSFTKQELKLFVEKTSDNKQRKKTSIIEPSFTKCLTTFPKHEQSLLKDTFELLSTSSINFSHKATINNTSNNTNFVYHNFILYYKAKRGE